MVLRFLYVFILPLSLFSQPELLLKEWKNDLALKGASYGYCVSEVKTNSLLAEYNSHLLLVPASTLKLLTTSAALKILGKDFRYQTKLLYTGTVNKQNGVLTGNLIISGSGDPTLDSENFKEGNNSVLDNWAKILVQKGIKEIKGQIIADASCFERQVPDDWIWADIGNYFGAIACGLSISDNKFTMLFNTGESGTNAEFAGTKSSYFSHPYNIHSEVMAKGNDDEAYVYGDPFGWSKTVRGTLPPNKKNYEVDAALPDPALYCAELFYQALQRVGIKSNKQTLVSNYVHNDSLNSATLLYTHQSPTLEKIIYYTNLKSNNQYCEAFLLTLGKGSSKKGLAAVKNYWLSSGLPPDEFVMTDGCGLARANLCTPFVLTQVLNKVFADSSTYKVLKNSLPVAGKNGSMSNVGKGSVIENNLVAKTGYIQRARAYSGYLTSKSGKLLSFSVMLNNYTCTAREAKLKLEKFLISLYEL